jgi:hypothetical protein
MKERCQFMKVESEEAVPPLSITRLYMTEIVFLRALLKGTTTDKLEQLKTIMTERCVDAMEDTTDMGDNLYKGMADATRLMILNFDFWIQVFGV